MIIFAFAIGDSASTSTQIFSGENSKEREERLDSHAARKRDQTEVQHPPLWSFSLERREKSQTTLDIEFRKMWWHGPKSTLQQLIAHCATDHSKIVLLRLPDVELLALFQAPPALTFITSIVAALL